MLKQLIVKEIGISIKNIIIIIIIIIVIIIIIATLTLKRLNLTPFCGFSKNESSEERMKPWFFATFNIAITHIFPQNFIEIPRVVQKI